MVFKWLGQPLGKKPQVKQLRGKEFKVVDKGLDEKQVTASVNDLTTQPEASQEASAALLRSIIQKAVTDAEQLVASIKVRAQAEAEAESASIIDQARQEADEIKRKAKIAVQEKIEQPVQLQEEAPEEKMEQPVQLQEEAVASEPTEATTEEPVEQHLQEESPSRETKSTPLKEDSQTLYTGEVDIDIATPIDLKMVSKLYSHLQTIPEIKILHTRGSWDRGTTITVVLEKPIPLISTISKIDGIEATLEPSEKAGLAKGKSSSLLGTRKEGTRRIKITLKE